MRSGDIAGQLIGLPLPIHADDRFSFRSPNHSTIIIWRSPIWLKRNVIRQVWHLWKEVIVQHVQLPRGSHSRWAETIKTSHLIFLQGAPESYCLGYVLDIPEFRQVSPFSRNCRLCSLTFTETWITHPPEKIIRDIKFSPIRNFEGTIEQMHVGKHNHELSLHGNNWIFRHRIMWIVLRGMLKSRSALLIDLLGCFLKYVCIVCGTSDEVTGRS